jgi:hypothetical protein
VIGYLPPENALEESPGKCPQKRLNFYGAPDEDLAFVCGVKPRGARGFTWTPFGRVVESGIRPLQSTLNLEVSVYLPVAVAVTRGREGCPGGPAAKWEKQVSTLCKVGRQPKGRSVLIRLRRCSASGYSCPSRLEL